MADVVGVLRLIRCCMPSHGDDSGDLVEKEVPFPVWRRLSHADADGDGFVTREEFESVQKPSRR